MSSGKRNPVPAGPGRESIIHRGTRVRGDIEVEGSLRIEGRVEGNVTVSGPIHLAPRAEIEGDVSAAAAVVSGRIRGQLKSRDGVDLLKGSHLAGDVYARSFRIEDGAFFQGNCFMGEAWVKPRRSENR